MDKTDLLLSLRTIVESFDNLPDQLLHTPITQYEVKVIVELLYEILKSDSTKTD